MNEITSVQLENEMDVILAHKQSMRLAELTGLALSAQTVFATAVSEVCRGVIGLDDKACLRLYVSDKAEKVKFITATLEDKRKNFNELKDEGYIYAKRLMSNISAATSNGTNTIQLNYRMPQSLRIDDTMLEKWRINLNTDPAVSPYEEIKRKNRQLVEMADKLKESERQYRSLTETLPIIIYTCTNDGEVLFANQWLEEYTGQTVEEINRTHWANVVNQDDAYLIKENTEKKHESDSNIVVNEVRLKDAKSGVYRWHTGATIAVKEDDGSVNTWNTFLVDIHAQKLIEQALRDNEELREIKMQLEEKVTMLNNSNKQLEQFAYVTSHDLQEPLRKISLYSDYLQSRYSAQLPEEAGMFFNNLINASMRMKVLVQDILTYSTVRKFEFAPVDLNVVFTKAVQDLEIAITENNATITATPLPTVDGDETQLVQLFENLVSNSLKFSKPHMPAVITLSAETVGDHAVLTITDNGIGFEEQYTTKMFDLFQKLHTRDKYAGTGIGLSICKKIVDTHKGAISANGNLGDGATFIIKLPLKQHKD